MKNYCSYMFYWNLSLIRKKVGKNIVDASFTTMSTSSDIENLASINLEVVKIVQISHNHLHTIPYKSMLSTVFSI